MFHTEPVYCVLVVVVCWVPVASIEVVVHQTVTNHDVVRVQGVVLLPQPQQRQLQSLIVVLVVLSQSSPLYVEDSSSSFRP